MKMAMKLETLSVLCEDKTVYSAYSHFFWRIPDGYKPG